jgi:putative inorganic carbon (hco3(-)) transporter
MKTLVGPRHESPTLVLVTTALIVVTVGRVMDLVPPLYGLPIVKILTVAAVLVFLLSPRVPRPGFNQSQLTRIVFAIVLLACASLAYSAWRSYSLMVITGSMAAITALTVLIYKSSGALATVEKYLRALAIAAGTLTLGGLIFRGEGRLAFGRQYDPNDLAFVLIAILPIVLAFWRVQRGTARWAWMAVAVGSVWVILLTQSRGGLLGLLMVVSYLGAVGAWRTGFQSGFRLGRVFVGWILLAILAVGAWTVLPGDAKERYATLLDPASDYNVTATREGRVSVWKRGLGSLAQRPWGVGVGAYPMAEMGNSGYWRTAHNSILELSVELGVVGGVLFLLLFWRAWRVLGAVMRAPGQGPPGRGPPVAHATSERWRIHAQHLRGTLIGILVTGFFLSQAYALVIYAVMAIVAALEVRYAPRTRAAVAPQSRAEPAPRAAPPRPVVPASPRGEAPVSGPPPRPYWS